MGQGVRTSAPLIVAEEVSWDWQSVQVVQADLEPKYGEQLPGGSLSGRTSYANLRKAGAAAREILLSAAAAEWGVSQAECHAADGEVVHANSQHRVRYGSLIGRAATLTPPADPALKSPAEFHIIGHPTPRTDTALKVTGEAKFGLDVRVPGMLIASVERCPVYGGTPRSYNVDEVGRAPGVRGVVEVKPLNLPLQLREGSAKAGRNYTGPVVA